MDQDADLEKDLKSCDWIKDKIDRNEHYRQNLYAALCNNQFQKNHTWNILKDEKWTCSWRYAGGIISELHGQGDYMNYYCSGMADGGPGSIYGTHHYVPEGVVTEEIKQDLLALGWLVKPYDD